MRPFSRRVYNACPFPIINAHFSLPHAMLRVKRQQQQQQNKVGVPKIAGHYVVFLRQFEAAKASCGLGTGTRSEETMSSSCVLSASVSKQRPFRVASKQRCDPLSVFHAPKYIDSSRIVTIFML